jgi:phosphotransferase system HPr (HPr) family protein
MIEKDLTIRNCQGLHVRPCNLLAELCRKYRSHVTVVKDGVVADGDSLLDLLILCAGQGTTLRFTVSGEDEKETMAAIEALVAGNFGEE